jgi:hypothetical protein
MALCGTTQCFTCHTAGKADIRHAPQVRTTGLETLMPIIFLRFVLFFCSSGDWTQGPGTCQASALSVEPGSHPFVCILSLRKGLNYLCLGSPKQLGLQVYTTMPRYQSYSYWYSNNNKSFKSMKIWGGKSLSTNSNKPFWSNVCL